eukprot:m.69584 g.69584  ORF g.69584 m.69584 type:complete len:517 (+) comp8595_c0_seq2:222-1772(+)
MHNKASANDGLHTSAGNPPFPAARPCDTYRPTAVRGDDAQAAQLLTAPLLAHDSTDNAYELDDLSSGADADTRDDTLDTTESLLTSTTAVSRQRHTYPAGSTTNAAAAGLGKSGTAASVVNLANTVLGAGMLGLPHAVAECGYGVGFVLLLVSACGTAVGLHLLAVSQATVGITPSSFYAVVNAAAPSLTAVIDIAVAIKCFGVATSYLIVIGDLMPDVVRQLGAEANRETWVAIGWVLSVPLSCMTTMDALKFTSASALVFVVFVTIVVVLFACGIPSLNPCPEDERFDMIKNESVPCRGEAHYASTDMTRTLRVLSIFVFSFTCQQNVFQLCSELSNPTIQRINRVIGISVTSSWVVYMTVAMAGFATYGDMVQSDVLINYPRSGFVSAVRVAVCLLVVFSYPLQSHPARRSLLTLLTSIRYGKDAKILPSNFEFYAVTAVFLVASLIVALSVTNLGTVLELVGATGSTTVSYILPGMVYWRLHPFPHPMRRVAVVQTVVGLCIVPIALTFILT